LTTAVIIMASPSLAGNGEGSGGGEIKTQGVVKKLVAQPCCFGCSIIAVALLMTLATMRIIADEGTDIFGQKTSYALDDPKSLQADAIELADALTATGDSGECEANGPPGTTERCSDSIVSQQSQRGAEVLLVYEESSIMAGKLFDVKNIEKMKSIEDEITLSERFGEFCRKAEHESDNYNSTPCDAPLSIVNIMYNSLEPANIDDDFIFNVYPAFTNAVRSAQVCLASTSLMGMITGNDSSSSSSAFSLLTSDVLQISLAIFTAACQGGTNATLPIPGLDAGAVAAALGVPKCVAACTAVNSAVGSHGMPAILDAASFPTKFLDRAMPPEKKLTQKRVDEWLQVSSKLISSPDTSYLVDYFFGSDFNATNAGSKYTRAMISMGLPLKGYKNKHDKRKEQSDMLSDWFRAEFNDFLKDMAVGEDMDVLYFATPIVGDEFTAILGRDMLFAIISLLLVYGYLTYQTGSLFLSSVGMAEILLSLPMAFFFYRKVFQFTYFDGLNALGLFIILAIGADDIFVFMDAFKQALQVPEAVVSLEARMAWTYSRAASAMAITSFTTMAAFVASALSPLAQIRSFGVFCAFLIFFDYILVITWFPAMVVFYHNNFEMAGVCDCCPARVKEIGGDNVSSTEAARAQIAQGKKPRRRKVEVLVGDRLGHFVITKKKLLVALCAALAVPAVYLMATVKATSETEEFLPSDHPFQRLFTITGREFPTSAEDGVSYVTVMWGVGDEKLEDSENWVDRSGVKLLWDSSNVGTLIMNTNFEFDGAAQQHILQTCDEAKKLEFVPVNPDDPPNKQVECFMYDFKNWAMKSNYSFPIVRADTALAALKEWMETNSPSGQQNPDGTRKTNGGVWGDHVAVNDERVLFASVVVDTNLRRSTSQTRDQLKTEYDKFEAWIQSVNSKAPPSARGAIQVCSSGFNGPKWVWMHTQTLFLNGAFVGGIAGALLAFTVLLIATHNFIVAFCSVLTILFILVTVIAVFVLIGWDIGTTESICLTILAGFAVDYVVHYAHAYMHAPWKKSKYPTERESRTAAAFKIMGISVFSGFATSVLASLSLFQCAVQFFSKFGVFLLTTVFSAYLWSNLFFMSLLALVGPQTNPRTGKLSGDISFLFPCSSHTAKTDSGENTSKEVELAAA